MYVEKSKHLIIYNGVNTCEAHLVARRGIAFQVPQPNLSGVQHGGEGGGAPRRWPAKTALANHAAEER